MLSRLAIRATLAATLVGTLMTPRVAAEGDIRPTHVRSTERHVVDALRQGYDRSPTFRRLVDELEASDVIVYVQPATQLPGSLRGHIRFAVATAANRYLRIFVSAKVRGDAFIALVGHELQHAGEVARSPFVRDDRSLAVLYRVIGDANSAGWDTDAACGIGAIVQDELRRGTRQVNGQ